ncbi:hypothetical protein LSH36_281g09088 [Paralvinella palmiformis]|uniref:Nuclear receptor domain-containing protein n=1 Tax=Paralvinella palmiformis TaxID=53620 RepID=A0AAD9JK59_9ANNE|nr:hypothetical protein LSH36_281g09088 [Paralvinella palmiformis]
MPCGVVPYPFGDCRVCADKATGIHYGVATCEGCKGFYKRSIPKSSSYRCFFGGSCILSKHNRNRCKACRFKRCLQVGMSTTAVKMGRIPKVDKERALQAFQQKRGHTQHQHLTPTIPQPDSSTDDVQPLFGFSQSQSDVHHEDSDPQLWPEQLTAGNHSDNVHSQMAAVPDDGAGLPYGISSDCEALHNDAHPQNNSSTPDLVSEIRVHSKEQPHYSPSGMHNVMTSDYHHLDSLDQPSSDTRQSPSPRQSCGPALSNVSDQPQRPESVKSNSSSTRGIFSPVIIKELLTQVIQSGNGANLKESLKNQLLTSDSEESPHSIIQEAIRSCNVSPDLSWHQTERMITDHEWDDGKLAFVKPKFEELWSVHSSDVSINLNQTRSDYNSGGNVEEPHQDTTADWAHSKQQQQQLFSDDVERISSCMGQSQDGASSTHQKETYISAGKLTDQLILGILHEVAQPTSRDTTCPNKSPATLHSVEDSKQVVAHANGYSLPVNDGFLIQSTHKTGPLEIDMGLPQHIDTAAPVHEPEGFTGQSMTDVVDPFVGIGNREVKNGRRMENRMMDVDPIYVERIEERFNFVYNISHRVIRLQERFMMLERAGTLPIHPLNKVNKATKRQVQYVWDVIMSSIPESNKIILDFCQSIPHFSALNSSDQALLLQEAYFDIWLICHSKLFHSGDTYLRFKCNTRYSRFWMSYILPETLICDLHKFTSELNGYSLYGSEIIVLCVLRLINPEREGLTDVELVHRIHGHYFDVLMNLIEKRHRGNHGSILVGLIQLLPSITSLNGEQKGVMDNFSVENVPKHLSFSEEDEADEASWKMTLDLSDYEKLDPSNLV